MWRDEEEREAPIDESTEGQRLEELDVSLYSHVRLTHVIMYAVFSDRKKEKGKKNLPDMTFPGCTDMAVMGIFPASNLRCNSFAQSTFASFVYAVPGPVFLPKRIILSPSQENEVSPYTFNLGLYVSEKSLLNASKLSYRGFGTHRCATEATCRDELRRSVTHMAPHIR
jgi:hypothetical protein